MQDGISATGLPTFEALSRAGRFMAWTRPKAKDMAITYIIIAVIWDMVSGHISIVRDLLIAAAVALVLGFVKFD